MGWSFRERFSLTKFTLSNEGSVEPEPRVRSEGPSPSLSNLIHAMSSPTHSTFQPGSAGRIMARFVLPQALGKAAAT